MSAQAVSRTEHFPRAALAAVALVLAAVLVYVALAREIEPQPRDLSSARSTSALFFEDRADGAVVVRDAQAGDVVAVFEPGTNGFVRGALRGLVRERKRREIGPAQPFILVEWPSGQLSLEDPATHHTLDLSAFGASNAAPFAQILSSRGRAS